MGLQEISQFTGEQRRHFMRALLQDLRALERMLESGLFEKGVSRIGVEQEMFLIDRTGHPALASLQMLERLGDPHFTTELGLFQLEANLDPRKFEGDCLSRMETDLDELLALARKTANRSGLEIVLAGILPTIRKSDLGPESMTPLPRYQALNDAATQLRGSDYFIHIRGIDELRARHGSVMAEACNASFQTHLQVDADEFANHYNVAQVLAGPVLAGAPNSPLLWGRRLWAETRIALFEQSVDSRHQSQARETSPRVTFGDRWVRRSVLEIYKQDVARFRALVGTDLDEDPFQKLEQGEVPELRALRLYNGTIYRWNRACYGITEGKPHLRIENRVLPSGPSVVDQIANAALWLGLMRALAKRYDDITGVIEFDHAKQNFTNAARQGLAAHLMWLEGEEISAPRLILEKLLPLAAEGLDGAGVRAEDRDRYLGVIERRVANGRTGAGWVLHSLGALRTAGTSGERLNALTAAMVARQRSGKPVSEWELARLDEGGEWKHNYFKVEQYMTTDLFTVSPDEPVDLIAQLMEWQRIRHVPVEDHEHRMVGLVSYRALLRLLSDPEVARRAHSISAADIMKKDPLTVSPVMPTLRAIEIMRQYGVGCLPVVHDGRLVGIVTEHDFMEIAGQLLERKLNE